MDNKDYGLGRRDFLRFGKKALMVGAGYKAYAALTKTHEALAGQKAPSPTPSAQEFAARMKREAEERRLQEMDDLALRMDHFPGVERRLVRKIVKIGGEHDYHVIYDVMGHDIGRKARSTTATGTGFTGIVEIKRTPSDPNYVHFSVDLKYDSGMTQTCKGKKLPGDNQKPVELTVNSKTPATKTEETVRGKKPGQERIRMKTVREAPERTTNPDSDLGAALFNIVREVSLMNIQAEVAAYNRSARSNSRRPSSGRGGFSLFPRLNYR